MIRILLSSKLDLFPQLKKMSQTYKNKNGCGAVRNSLPAALNCSKWKAKNGIDKKGMAVFAKLKRKNAKPLVSPIKGHFLSAFSGLDRYEMEDLLTKKNSEHAQSVKYNTQLNSMIDKLNELLKSKDNKKDIKNCDIATALLVQHPDWNISHIAREIGVDRKTPYNLLYLALCFVLLYLHNFVLLHQDFQKQHHTPLLLQYLQFLL